MDSNLIIYNTEDGKAQVKLYTKDGAIWMNQQQMALLFDTSKQNISFHIGNILLDKELDGNSVVKNYLTTASGGKKQTLIELQKYMKRLLLFAALALTVQLSDAQTKVTIFGDSYSTFEGYITPNTNESWFFTEGSPYRDKNNDVCKVEQTWWHQAIERLGWKLETNNSYSGATVGYHGYEDECYQPRSFNTRVAYLGEPDVILSCCGTNDSWSNEKVGEYKYANWTESDMWYFRPAMARLCSTLRQNYPMTKVYFILNSELRDDISESMRVICRHYGFPLIELHDIEKQDGHPSQAGMKSISDQVVEYIKKEK